LQDEVHHYFPIKKNASLGITLAILILSLRATIYLLNLVLLYTSGFSDDFLLHENRKLMHNKFAVSETNIKRIHDKYSKKLNYAMNL